MRVLSLAGIRFGRAVDRLAARARDASRWPTSLAPPRRRSRPAAFSSAMRALVTPPDVDRRTRLAWRLLVAWMAIRFALLALRSRRGGRCIRGTRGSSGRPRRASGTSSGASSRSRVPARGSPPAARLVRRLARISADGAAAAGVGLHRARPLGRRADELAVVAVRGRAHARRLRWTARSGGAGARRARRRLPRRVAAARQRPRRAGGLRRPAHGGYFAVAALAFLRWRGRAIAARRGRRAAPGRRLHAIKIPGSSGR